MTDIKSVDIELNEVSNDTENMSTTTESTKRSCMKAVTWRIIAFITTMVISYIYLGDISEATQIGIIDTVIKFIIHYVYERGWTKIKWGYE